MRALLLVALLTPAVHAAAVDLGSSYFGRVGIGSQSDRFDAVDVASLTIPSGDIAATWTNADGVAVFEASGIVDGDELLYASLNWIAGEPMRVEIERWARPVDPADLDVLTGSRFGTKGLAPKYHYEMYPLPHSSPGQVLTRELVSLDSEIGYDWSAAMLAEGLAGAPIEAYLKVTLTSLTQPVPEPAAGVLLALGLLAIVCRLQVRVR